MDQGIPKQSAQTIKPEKPAFEPVFLCVKTKMQYALRGAVSLTQ